LDFSAIFGEQSNGEAMPQLLTHPARRANLLLAVILLALPACTVGPWEKEFWHPPAATGVAPIEGQSYPLRRAAGEFESWPDLADVPARQPAPLSAADEARELQALTADRASGQAQAAAVALAPAAPRSSTSGEIAVPAQPPTPPAEIGE
jgi:hypothetical protein